MEFITFHILAPDEVVVRAGEPSTFLGLLVWGEVDVLDHKGKVVDVADQGALIGEAALFFGGQRLTSARPSPHP